MDDVFNTSYYDYYEPLIYNGTAQYTPETCERLEEMIDFIASTIPSNCSSAGGCTIPINTPLLTLPVATDLIINGNGENSYEFTPHRCAIIRFIDPNSVPSGGGSFTTPIGIPHSTITELVSFDCSTMTVQLKIGTNPVSTPATVYFPYYELNSFYPNSCEDFMPWYTPIVETAEINLDSAYLECIEQQTLDLENEADQIYNGMIDSLITEYINNDPCLDNPLAEQFTASYNTVEHHYTLYYYDQAGSLIQTVPPRGVNPLDDTHFTAGIWDGTPVNHTLETRYRYNTLGQIRWQESPDGGETNFYYDHVQRLRMSVNDKQRVDGSQNQSNHSNASYTKYDAQSRIVEVGQVDELPDALLGDPTTINDGNFPEQGSFNLSQQTITEYDTPNNPAIDQSNLRGRVSRTVNEHIATYYDYDIHGNVKKLHHQIPYLGAAEMEYEYDLISGNVNEVWFQKNTADQFGHHYQYDADNRLTHVETSTDGYIWDQEAKYYYYSHGPLARVELGEDNVQGLDYYYNLQGWIKGVNIPSDNEAIDPGQDGYVATNNPNRWIPKDEMSYHLGYYEGDYKPIGANVNLGLASTSSLQNFNANILTKSGNPAGLFNGNITSMITNIPGLVATGVSTEAMNAMAYQYDALHRIKQAKSYAPNSTAWTANGSFDSEYSYDPNGNIMSLKRFGLGQLLDDLEYKYERFVNGAPDLEHNQLQQVIDIALQGNTYNDLASQPANNYNYDAIGNLTADGSESIDEIEWTVYGKVKSIKYAPLKKKGDINFAYDAAGNRLIKSFYNLQDQKYMSDMYVRDASGNIMGVYTVEVANDTTTGNQIFSKHLKDINLYGSSRLGNYRQPTGLETYDPSGFSDTYPFHMAENLPIFTSSNKSVASLRGHKSFELANHLGNVLATVSDKKIGHDSGASGAIKVADYYEADVKSASDYYPFGWSMPGRKYQDGDYRFGFNGKENDQEWGSQVIQDYGLRIYNPSIGKFLSFDPLAKSFPWNSPYSFAENDVIQNIDLDGAEKFHYTRMHDDGGCAYLVLTDIEVYEAHLFGLIQGAKNPEEHVVHTDIGLSGLKYSINRSYGSYEEALNSPDSDYSPTLYESTMSNPAMHLVGGVGSGTSKGIKFSTGKALRGRVKSGGLPAMNLLSKTQQASVKLASFMSKPGRSFNIELGARQALTKFAESGATTFKNMNARGFSTYKDTDATWFKMVQESIHTAVGNGGRIKFHLDDINVKALYDETLTNKIPGRIGNFFSYKGSTIKELRYIINNGLLKHVDFMKGGLNATDDVIKNVNKAIDTYKKGG